MNEISKTSPFWDISTRTILKIIFILLLLWFLYVIRSVLVILFVALIVASIIDPLADWFERRHWPIFRHRAIAAFLIYLILILIFALVVALLVPPIVEQIRGISEDFPTYWEKLTTGFESLKQQSEEAGIASSIQKGFRAIEANLGQTASGVFSTLSTIFGGLVSFLVILVIAFYMVVEEDAIKGVVLSIFPDKYLPYLTQLITRIQRKIGSWARGQIVLSLIIGILVYLGLLALHVKYALILAILAALLEFIPYLGPIIAAIPAVFLAFMEAPLKGLVVILLYIIIQQLENHIVAPQVMKRAVGLNPIICIIALLIGAKVAGFFGVVLAIPLVTALSVVIKDFFEQHRV